MNISAASPLRDYLDSAGALPADVLLGRIVLFTITDQPVAHDDLEKWFDELALDKAQLPGRIREIDAFKKATARVDRATYPLSRDRTAHLLCREVAATGDLLKRQLTREVQDSRHRQLSYTAAVDATFYRASDPNGSARVNLVVQHDQVEPEEVDQLSRVAGQVEQDYLRYRDFHDGQKLRALVRTYLKALAAIEIKGGTYFIHVSRDDELRRLTELVNRFGGGCAMHAIPIVNLESERKFITRAFEREAAQALQEVQKDCQELLTTRKQVTSAAYAKAKARYDEVLEQAQGHMANLQVSQDVTAASAEVALNALMELQERMLES